MLVVSDQRDFFLKNQTKSIDFRIEQLKKLKSIIEDYQQKIFEALNSDLKKSYIETYVSEYKIVIDEIDYAIKNLKKWALPQAAKISLSLKPAKAEIVPVPYGVTLIISPWNYPFQLAILPMVGAIAAGNTVVLKPSEISKQTEQLLVEMINSNFDSNYLHVVAGGAETAQNLLKQKFDFIFFTGSPSVGKLVMKAAAENLTPVCLELGGKSPCVVDESANLEVAARRIVWGKFFNTGQTCVAPDYVYVHESVKGTLITFLKKTIREFYGENENQSQDYGRIISDKHYERLVGLLGRSRILYGGDHNKDERFISPTLLDVKGWDEEVMKEEIFGPLLPILSYQDISTVFESIQKGERPLAAYIFSENKGNIEKFIQLDFGGGCINDCLLQFSSKHLPAGGIGSSGIGSYHGKYSFDTFSHKKSLVYKSNMLDSKLRYPPYTERKTNILKKLLNF